MNVDKFINDIPIWMLKRVTGPKRVLCKSCAGEGIINIEMESYPGCLNVNSIACPGCGGVGMVLKRKIVYYDKIV